MEGAGARAGFVAGCVFGIGLTICAIFSFLESREFIMEQIEIQLERFAYPMQEIGSLLKVIMIVGPIVIFLTSAIFGLLFGLLYHYLYLHNPRLRTMYGALAGVLFGIFFGFTTNMPPLSRVKTVVICLVLGSIYSVVLLCLHSGYIEIVQLDLDRLQISILEAIKREKPKFAELLNAVHVDTDEEKLRNGLRKLDDLKLITEDYQNRYIIKDAGKLLLRGQKERKKN